MVPGEQIQRVPRLAGRHLGIGGIGIQIHAVWDPQPFAFTGIVFPVGVILLVFTHAIIFAANPAAQNRKLYTGILHPLPVNLPLMVTHINPVMLNGVSGCGIFCPVGIVGDSFLGAKVAP